MYIFFIVIKKMYNAKFKKYLFFKVLLLLLLLYVNEFVHPTIIYTYCD